MPESRVLPSDYLLERMVKKGMTHQEIADKISAETGVKVGRSAVSAALSRAGMTDRKRYDDTIPWRVKLEHQNCTTIWMLRIAHRVKHGEKVTPEERTRFAAWKKRLDEQDAVIVYIPDSPDGFYRVLRERGEDLIRP